MLRAPYRRYSRLYTYHLDAPCRLPGDDPDLIGVWPEDDGCVLFFHRPKDNLVAEICRQNGARQVYQADLDYDDWEAGRQVASFTVAGLRVAPVWEEGPADIRLDPSVIFGSGFHPSTRLCLEMLGKYQQSPEAGIHSVLDLGCGTGLLAIAAARGGARRVLAVDNNSLACQVAAANCRLNEVEEIVTVSETDLRRHCPDTGSFDLVIANLYQDLLGELFQQEIFWRSRLLIVAGFIEPMEEKLLGLLPAGRLRLLERNRRERWCVWVLSNARGFCER
ncbi:50S ribosomal protein L11 methyltransferase [Desulfurivibrio sp. C05AmB]|uniref:50S ribosomal protein L11 methyltransferase n=1 Tax=Desulfurivibrio sp. C05AmB TaxID=3374371 RepID=UPI00376EB028